MSVARMVNSLNKMALEVDCPRCFAQPGSPCQSAHPKNIQTPSYPVRPHQERKRKAVKK